MAQNARRAGSCTTSAAACGQNLIADPGAESSTGATDDVGVPVAGWKATGGFTVARYSWAGGDLSLSTPGSTARGENYFYGGPSHATSTGTQVLALPAGSVTGKTTYVVSGWLGGLATQDDEATLFVTFLDAAGEPLAAQHKPVAGVPGGLWASRQIGPVTEAQRDGVTELVRQQASGTVPPGTRSVALVPVMQRTDGDDNDGLADNLSLALACG